MPPATLGVGFTGFDGRALLRADVGAISAGIAFWRHTQPRPRATRTFWAVFVFGATLTAFFDHPFNTGWLSVAAESIIAMLTGAAVGVGGALPRDRIIVAVTAGKGQDQADT